MSEEKTHGDLKFFFGLFLGGIIGALVIFFLGTKEGKKAGKQLEDKSREALDDMKSKVHDLEEKGRDVVDEFKQTVDELEQKGKELLVQGNEIKNQVSEVIEEKKEELTQSATEKLESALAHIEELQEQSLSTTAAIRRKFFKNLPKKR